jgi:excisionase family DNA binding protein
MTDRLLTADEVAAMVNVPTSWVRESTRSGAIPHLRLGRYVRYREEAVLAWLEECSRPSRPVAFRGVGPVRAARGI